MPNHVIAWWKYNPLSQKPTTLEPVLPWSWYYYYGPDPAAGVSYGQYHDKESDVHVITKACEKVFSPITGKPMEFISDVPYEEIKGMMTKATAGEHQSIKCLGCGTSLVSDMVLVEAKCECLHCPCCGSDKVEVTSSSIQKKGNETMRNREEIKARIAARVKERKAKASLASKIKEKIEAKRKAEAENEDEYVSLDEILEAMNEKSCASEEAPKAAEPKAEAPATEAPATEAPKAEDEYMDLDMVLSMLKKRRVSAKAKERARRRIRARVIARRRAIAEEIKEEAPKAAEPKAEAPATEAPKAEPNMVSEENPIPETCKPEEAEAMRFEPLASTEVLASVKKEDIDMVLYGEGTENPFWNVSIAGVPAARVQLKDQDSAEEIRQVFCSEDYASELVDHCIKAGFINTMKNVNASFWSNHTSNKKVEAFYMKKAEEKFESEKKKLIASLREDFLHSLRVATAGMNKNFYPELGNPLKDHFFSNLTTVGLPEQTAISSIEKSFKEGASEYFDTLFNKAIDYMGMSKEARAEIATAISNSSALDHYSDGALQNAEPATIKERLAQASVAPRLMATAGLTVREELSIDAGEFKNQLRSVWKK